MNTSLVVTVMGPNTLGVVQKLAEIAAEFDASWLRARMANLAGQFAGVFQVEVAVEKADALDAALHRRESTGLHVMTTRGDSQAVGAQTDLHRLELVCQDHPGIVRDTAGMLARNGVSIEDLTTDCVSGAFSGERMFQATAQLRVPENLEIARLREVLEALANELMVDLTLDDRRIH
ncbi:MAG: glycine cleavage system protein R [Pseudomonadota bacterium]|nr:glycine cleavage system protein R [Pseudomonadota bacterium]